MNEQPPLNPRQLRAAAETVRGKLRIAKGGAFATLLCFVVAHELSLPEIGNDVPSWIPAAFWIAGPLIGMLAVIPVLRVACPKCKGRYCTFLGVYRRANNPPPCACCGFDVEGHIPRYG